MEGKEIVLGLIDAMREKIESQALEIERLEKENQAHAKHREAVTKSVERVDAASSAYIQSLENQVAELQARAQLAAPVGVSDGWRESLESAALLLEVHSPGSGSVESYAAQDIRAMLAAAPSPAPEHAENRTTGDKYRAELYDEVWQKARDMGYGNVT